MSEEGIRADRWRRAAGPALLLAAALAAGGLTLAQKVRKHEARRGSGPDPVVRMEERLAPARKVLPARGTVGFLTDVRDPSARSAVFYMTQYSLAPVVVQDDTRHPLVVGNFLEIPPPPEMIREAGLVPVVDLGNGVVLYRGEGE